MVRLLIILLITFSFTSCKLESESEVSLNEESSGDNDSANNNNGAAVVYKYILTTDSGLVKVSSDFQSWEEIDRNSGYSSDLTKAIIKTANNQILANGFYISISSNDGETWDSKNPIDGVSNTVSYIDMVYFNGSDTLFVASASDGLYISGNEGNNFTNVTTAESLPSNNLTALGSNGFGNLYVGTTTGLYASYDTEPLGAMPIYDFIDFATDAAGVGANADSNYINSISCIDTADVDCFVGTNNGLFQTKFEQTYDSAYLIGRNVYDFKINSKGHWIVATDSGVQISTDNGASFTRRWFPDGLPESWARKIFIAADDTIIVSTRMGIGVSTDDGATFTTYNTGDGLVDNDVYEIIEL